MSFFNRATLPFQSPPFVDLERAQQKGIDLNERPVETRGIR